MIRLILILCFLVIFFVVSIPIFGILWIVGKFSKEKQDRMSYALVVCALKGVRLLSGAKVIVKGKENIPENQAVLYVSNHRSFFDIVIGYTNIPPLAGFISKKEIKKVPILAQWMKRMNCLFLDRSNIKEGLKMILEGVEKLKSGISIVIFPEGKRAATDDGIRDFKEGSLKMAEKSGCPIIPVAFNNTSAILEDHFPRIKRAVVVIEFGKPIYIDTLEKEDKKHLGAYTHDKVKAMVEANKSLIK